MPLIVRDCTTLFVMMCTRNNSKPRSLNITYAARQMLNNNNLHLIMVKTNCSTLHTVYNIQQSAMQGSNDTTHRLSRRTAATTRFSTEGIGCQKQMVQRCCQHTMRWAFTLQALTRWRHLSTYLINWPATHLSTPEGWKAGVVGYSSSFTSSSVKFHYSLVNRIHMYLHFQVSNLRTPGDT